MEEIGGRLQGGVTELPDDSRAGLLRGTVNPGDGQFYSVRLRGWITLVCEDGSFERVRYTGEPVHLPVGLSVSPEGVEIEFTAPLDPDVVTDPTRYDIERWEYIYSERYGSPEVSLALSGEEGGNSLYWTPSSLQEDGR